MQKKRDAKRGISLIVLVITIIVMIILASTVVITLNNSGIIALSNKAVFKQNVKSYLTDLELYMAEQLAQNPTLNMDEINATDQTLALMITSIKEEDKEKFTVKNGTLVYQGLDVKEMQWCNEANIEVTTGYDVAGHVNAPNLSEGMIPVKYDSSSGKWLKADKNNANNDWYIYDDQARQWANVVTVKANGTKTRQQYLDAPAGTPIEMSDITTMFVWIPRYAYSINEGYYKVADELSEENENSNQKIDITFLIGNSNVAEKSGGKYIEYATDYDASKISVGEATPKIVHPAFTFGEDELTGIWVAKFEASGSTNTPEDFASYPGNASATSSTTPEVTDETYITILPSVPSWRSITIGDSQYQSMRMAEDANNAYGFDLVDTHLIKNIEWGAVAYLCASKYGKIPKINMNLTISTAGNPYDGLRGYLFGYNKYNTIEGVKASTTHNIYGIYDMNGGARERVAAYLDIGSISFNWYGGIYFESNALKVEYTKYWDKYEASEEEKSNKIQVADLGDGVTEVTQSQLFSLTRTINGEKIYTIEWNEARYRITRETYNLMASKKGDAMYETMADNSYNGICKITETEYNWGALREKDSTIQSVATTWNGDKTELVFGGNVFVQRGGGYGNGLWAGVLSVWADSGHEGERYGFRPVCVVF